MNKEISNNNIGAETVRAIFLHRETIALFTAIILLPFFMLSNIIPFLTEFTLGEDFTKVYMRQQIELMFALKTGTFPLFIPDFAAGQTASSLTSGQIFHPISHLASLFPGYWNGKAAEWITFFKLLSLGCSHIFLFFFLRQLKLNRTVSFIISTITVYNLRMLDLFRYGSSLESWTGFLFLCVSIGICYLNIKKKRGPILVVGSTYWLICSGHPQMMYYGLIGGALFALLAPYYIPVLTAGENEHPGKLYFWSIVGLCFVIGILLSSAYIIPFYFDFVLTNAGRVGQDYAWADGYRDTFAGTLNNLFYPLRSDVHGAFGGSSLILFIIVTPVLSLFRVKIPKIIWIILGIILVLFLYIQGSRTPVYYFFWKYFPFISSFRVAGRIALIIPVFSMMILAWLMKDDLFSLKFKDRKTGLNRYSIIPGCALILVGIYICIPESIISNSTLYSPVSIREIPPLIEQFALIIGVMIILFLIIYIHYTKLKILSIFLCFLICIQIQIILYYGTWIDQKIESPSFSQISNNKKVLLGYHPALGYGYGMYSSNLDRHLEVSCLEPFLGRVVRKYISVEDNEEYYRLQSKKDLSFREIIIEGFNDKVNTNNNEETVSNLTDSVELIYSSYNRLVFNVQNSYPGFFLLSYPFSDHWTAAINEKYTNIYRANGVAQAIYLAGAGNSIIEFRYWSKAALWGMIISCVTFLLSGLFISLYYYNKPLNYLLVAMVVSMAGLSMILWYKSLYHGKNLSYKFVWSYSDIPSQANYAYGKKTMMSTPFWEDHYHLYHNSRAVDGDRRMNSGLRTILQKEPFWRIDLNHRRKVGRITLYENINLSTIYNTRPLEIYAADENQQWYKVASITDEKKGRPINIVFKKAFNTRYIDIRASGGCFLQFDEVEIYAPNES